MMKQHSLATGIRVAILAFSLGLLISYSSLEDESLLPISSSDSISKVVNKVVDERKTPCHHETADYYSSSTSKSSSITIDFTSVMDTMMFFLKNSSQSKNVSPSSELCVRFPTSSHYSSSVTKATTTPITRKQRSFLTFFTDHLVSQLSFPWHWKYPDTSLYYSSRRQSLSSSSSSKKNVTTTRKNKKYNNKHDEPLSELVDPYIHPRARFPLYKKLGDRLQSVKCDREKCCLGKTFPEEKRHKFILPRCSEKNNGEGDDEGENSLVCKIPENFLKVW